MMITAFFAPHCWLYWRFRRSAALHFVSPVCGFICVELICNAYRMILNGILDLKPMSKFDAYQEVQEGKAPPLQNTFAKTKFQT